MSQNEILNGGAKTTLDQIVSLADDGDFLSKFLKEHRDVLLAMVNHKQEHGGKVSASFTLKGSYVLDKHGVLQLTFSKEFQRPKEPKAGSIAWMTDDGFFTQANPNQSTMQFRDVGQTRALPDTATK